MLKFLKTGFSKLKKALAKSALGSKLTSLFKGKVDEALLETLEQILFEADLGSQCALHFTEEMRQFVRKHPSEKPERYTDEMVRIAREIFDAAPAREAKQGHPHIVLIVGVNGSGKTTTIAKLAKLYKNEGKKVLLAAADTFRAAAIEQLETWAKRAGTDIVRGKPGADPGAVVFDALEAAKARGCDTVLIDTAGRLQSKTDLMHELGKVGRIIKKFDPEGPHETLLVVDATTGQNAIDQAKTFDSYTPLTGLIVTKLDGSAKGGIALSIYKEMRLPIEYIGLGEQMDDLEPFNKATYVDALFR